MSDKDQVIKDEQLEGVAGGGDVCILDGCHFTTNGETRTDGKRLWGKCESHCFGLIRQCACHRKDHCVDRWHLLNLTTHELEPYAYSNHRDKFKSRGYNT